MKCIVPLAGPDLERPEYGLRPMFPVDGRPLLAVALDSRPWRQALSTSDYVFVVRETPQIDTLLRFLRAGWPSSRVVRLSDLTEGAMLSAVAATALVGRDEPLIVDLADILFACSPDLTSFQREDLGAVVPCFTSAEPCYSYLRTEGGRVVEAAEKCVISDQASAGVYIFRSAQVYWRAAAHAFDQAEQLTHAGAFFVCPMVNGVLDQRLEVEAPPVQEVRPVSKFFHRPAPPGSERRS